MKIPVELILGLFGLANAGVALSGLGPATGFVTLGLLVGKPVGILLLTLLAVKLLRFEMPEGMRWGDVATLGMAAGVGFTVALFVSTVAFKPGDPADPVIKFALNSAKLGALGSFAAFFLTIVMGRIFGVKKVQPGVPPEK